MSLWWAFVNRNKRLVSVDFGEPEGAELLKALVRDADVLIESFRPGTFERWGLGPDVLHAINPRRVIVRCSGSCKRGMSSGRLRLRLTTQASGSGANPSASRAARSSGSRTMRP